MQCNSEREQTTQLLVDKVATSHNCKFLRVGVLFVTVRIQFPKNAYKSYHVYKVIVVLLIYSKILGALGITWNGMEWNGMDWNGMVWNGME